MLQYLDIEMIYWYFDASEHHYVCETGLCVCVCGGEFVTAVFCLWQLELRMAELPCFMKV